MNNCKRAFSTHPLIPERMALCCVHTASGAGVSEGIARVLKQQLPSTVFFLDQISRNRPSTIWGSAQNQLQTVQFCSLWPNRTITEDAVGSRAEKADHNSKGAPWSYDHDCYYQTETTSSRVAS